MENSLANTPERVDLLVISEESDKTKPHMNEADSSNIQRIAEYLRNSRRMLIFTGAGISTNSGIPDFRGPQGVWTRRKPVYYQDFMSSEAARVEHWDYKLEQWQVLRDAKPNAIHHAIVDLERAGK